MMSSKPERINHKRRRITQTKQLKPSTMKKFILFVILLTMPCVCISQITNHTTPSVQNDSLSIGPDQVPNVYKGLKQNESLTKEVERLKQTAIDLNKTIQEQNVNYQTVFDEVMELNSQIAAKNNELVKKEGEIEKLKSKTKRFSIGPSVGIGIDGKMYGGIAVNYALFRF